MRRTVSIALLSLFVLTACNKQQQQTASGPASAPATMSQPTPEQLGEIGAAIRKEPAKADSILAAHGLDQKSFEAAIRKVTESPAESKRYAAAFKKAT